MTTNIIEMRGITKRFGKLVANSLTVFYGVLAVLPVMAIPLLMGGVTVSTMQILLLVAAFLLMGILWPGTLPLILFGCQPGAAPCTPR